MNDALLALADLDAAIVRARHAIGHPPALLAQDGALAELRELRTRKRELDAQLEPLTQRVARLEVDGAAARERAATIAARLDAATGADRSLEAMVHERDALAARAAEHDDELLALLQELEPLEARDAELRSDAERVARRRDDLALEVAEERARATATLEALTAERPALAAAIEPSLLARYEAIAGRAGGVGAARLVGGRCGACRVTVPAAIVDQLEHGADHDAVAVCDECGRLLVR
ncbi:MAG TPA: C4-type zinc ribbon domain-containing protein [Acidimicrobiales bacterium]|nr:C4-type zinc ribbon domain-containing protein [Acidimicrobiales bacterium]